MATRRTKSKKTSQSDAAPIRALGVLGMLTTIGSLGLPWIGGSSSIPIPFSESILDALTAEGTADAVRGYEIPIIAMKTERDFLARTSAALAEFAAGRPDRAAARALFGDRYEEQWAWVVLVPASVALLHLLRWRFAAPGLRSTLIVLDLVLLLAVAYAVHRLPTLGGVVDLEPRSGLYGTILGLAALLLGLALGRR